MFRPVMSCSVHYRLDVTKVALSDSRVMTGGGTSGSIADLPLIPGWSDLPKRRYSSVMRETAAPTKRAQSWLIVLGFFCATSVVEAIGLSQVFAFMPLYLEQLGLPPADVPRWTGTLSALAFVLGLPLVPFWGVWADRYSRKAVIIRSCVVEVVVFGLIATSRDPWQLAASFILSGFQLGNSGVMLAALRDVTPTRRIGLAIGLYGATWPVGSALGPAIGGFMVDSLHLTLPAVYALSAALSAAVAMLLGTGLREVRSPVIPRGRVVDLALGSVRGIFTDPIVRRLFALYGISFLARQLCSPFLPLLVQQTLGDGRTVASAIALVVGVGALVGGLVSPVAGAAGDHVGFRRVLLFCMAGSGAALLVMPFSPDLTVLAVVNTAFSALSASVGTMIFGMLAMEVAPERRSATLNLVYLPLYLAGIVGPAIGAVVASAGLQLIFMLAGAIYGLGALFAAATRGTGTRQGAR